LALARATAMASRRILSKVALAATKDESPTPDTMPMPAMSDTVCHTSGKPRTQRSAMRVWMPKEGKTDGNKKTQ
jgi:hypothetical protein